MPNVLITGATRGLGRATAEAAAAGGAHVLVAGRDAEVVRAVADSIDGEPVVVDLADLSSVRAAAAALPHVDAIACNAAVQIVRGLRRTRNCLEETFAVNHLAHLALVDALLRPRGSTTSSHLLQLGHPRSRSVDRNSRSFGEPGLSPRAA